MPHSVSRYTAVAIALHWAIAIAVLAMIPMGWWMTAALDQPGGQATAYRLFQLHKSVGFLILALTIGRIIWRLTHRPPPLPGGMKPWEAFGARAVHVAFYALLLALPLTGWLYVSAGWAVSQDQALEVATSWFGLIPIPHLPGVAGLAEDARRALAFQAMGAHALLAWGAVLLVILHVGAALKHQFVDRDGVLSQMIPWLRSDHAHEAGAASAPGWTASPWATRASGVGLIVAVALAGAIAARPQARDIAAAAPGPAPAAAVAQDAPVTPGTAAAWRIDAGASRIEFGGTHAGAPFLGRFERWEGQVWFDPDDLAGSKAVVTVWTGSARTGDATQEGSLRGAEWLDPGGHPTARFEAAHFRALGGDRYEATGTLRLKGASAPVVLPFTFRRTGDRATVEGQAELDRIALGLGLASDAGAAWVSRAISVRIHVVADRD